MSEYKVSAMHGRRDKLGVEIYTQNFIIEGFIHSMPGSRLVDFLNSKTGVLFIVVTDARIYSIHEHHLLHTLEFLVLNRDEILMVFPRSSPSLADAPDTIESQGQPDQYEMNPPDDGSTVQI
jgi:hypothetical protein